MMWLAAASKRFSSLCFFAKWAMFRNQPRSTKATSLKKVGLKYGSAGAFWLMGGGGKAVDGEVAPDGGESSA